MRWEDEHYVKMYTRDSATWLMMPWQSRALLPLLMRKVDAAGLLPLGSDHVAALAALTGTPCDFVSPGFEGLQKFGVISMHGNVLEVPNFVAAQEARKTAQLRKRDERERAKAAARAELILQPTEITQTAVTRSHTKSRGVTRRHSSSSSPTPSSSPERDPADAGHEKASTPHKATIAALCDAFAELRRTKYAFKPRDAKAVATMLGHSEPAEIERRWRRALMHQGFPEVAEIYDLDAHWNRFGGTGPPQARRGGAATAAEKDWSDVTPEEAARMEAEF